MGCARVNMKILGIMILLSVAAHAQNWANTTKYSAENQLLSSVKSDNRIVLMGDSITEFWKQRDPAFFEDKPYLLNRGIGGQTTPQMLARFDQDVIALRPNVVVILAGTNDIAGNTGPISIDGIMENLIQMAERAANHQIKVVMCTLLPAAAFPWNPSVNPTEKIIALNKKIKAYARKKGIVCADYFAVMADQDHRLKKEYSGDGVHPNKKGYKAMEPVLQAALQQTLLR